MNAVAAAAIGLFAGFIAGAVTLSMLVAAGDADRTSYWEQVATTLANWAWAAAHSQASEARHDDKPSQTLHRAMEYVNATVMRDAR